MTSTGLVGRRAVPIALSLLGLSGMLAMGCSDGGTSGEVDAGRDGGSLDASADEDGGAGDDGGADDDAGAGDEGGAGDGGSGGDAGPPIDGGPGSCRINGDCARDSFCSRPEGMCSAVGRCEMRPEICMPVIMQVCGCDGVTYDGGECSANAAGTSVAHDGACGSMACMMRPPAGCCFDDGQCPLGGPRGEFHCVEAVCRAGGAGVCKDSSSLGRGECWSDVDCPDGRTCVGADVCDCGVACLVPDSPGTCAVTM